MTRPTSEGPIIAPAVLAETPQDYQHDLDIATSLSDRVQIDLVDGRFASHATINLAQSYWPPHVSADLHLMYDDPYAHLETLIAMHPSLVIVHAEAADLNSDRRHDMAKQLHAVGIKFGMAILPDTSVHSIQACMEYLDHILVFTGELGHYGGAIRLDCLDKIAEVKRHVPSMEVGVDGGVNDETAGRVVAAGADVLNVGGYLQRASRPQDAYATLKAVVTSNQT